MIIKRTLNLIIQNQFNFFRQNVLFVTDLRHTQLLMFKGGYLSKKHVLVNLGDVFHNSKNDLNALHVQKN